MEKVKISTPFIKLDQLLKFAGLADSGGVAKAWILDGFVKVNGSVALERGKKIVSGDTVQVDLDGDQRIIKVE